MKIELRNKILGFQRNELTEHFVYKDLARVAKDPKNKDILGRISEDELKHYRFWKELTKEDVRPKRYLIFFYSFLARFFGLAFATKLMEKAEGMAQDSYESVVSEIPEVRDIIADEEEHEAEILRLTEDRVLIYVSSIVLGLNDALVELTGALAGFTFAFKNTSIIAMAGSITGIAAALSMGASEFMSTRSERSSEKSAAHAAIYTSIAYILVVLALILPYLFLTNVFVALGISLLTAIFVIVAFSFYVSVAQEVSFKEHVLTMGSLSMGVAVISFGIGYLAQKLLHVQI